jgi:hypothetical protein
MNTPISSSILTAESLKPHGWLHSRSPIFDLCFWPCPHGKNEVVFEGYIKVKNGLKHLVSRYERISILDAFSEVAEHGFFSPRPYLLGQSCDGSINACALALFARFCRDEGHSIELLYRQAYPEDKQPDWPELIRFAEWQEVAYPQKWDAEAVAGLLTSLHEINYHSLAGVVSDLAEGGAK